MGNDILIVMLKSEASGSEDNPIIKSFIGAEKERAMSLTFEDLLQELCAGEGFYDDQKNIARYATWGIAKTKQNGYSWEREHLLLKVFDSEDKPKMNPRTGYADIYIKEPVKDYVDEREHNNTKFDCLDFLCMMIGDPC